MKQNKRRKKGHGVIHTKKILYQQTNKQRIKRDMSNMNINYNELYFHHPSSLNVINRVEMYLTHLHNHDNQIFVQTK